jgi:hypothetical protein
MARTSPPRFTRRLVVVLTLVAGCAATAAAFDTSADPAGAAATNVVARYEFNEPANASILKDSGPNGIDGEIGDIVQQPVTATDSTGAVGTGHRFPSFSPPEDRITKVFPERLNVVADNALLDPGTEDYAITVRFRKTSSYGNILQKGQNTVPGGYFKIEMPFSTATCVFKDLNAVSAAVTSPAEVVVNDGKWHVLRCEKLKTEVKMWVDGVEVAKTGRVLANIANNWPLVFGGKYDCDGPEPGTTCDYFVGDIDYVIFEKGSGGPPTTTTTTTSPTSTTTTTTQPGSTTTTTIVDQLPPGFLDEIPDAADGGEPAERLGNAATEPGTTVEGTPLGD